jgi:hypothetical protein
VHLIWLLSTRVSVAERGYHPNRCCDMSLPDRPDQLHIQSALLAWDVSSRSMRFRVDERTAMAAAWLDCRFARRLAARLEHYAVDGRRTMTEHCSRE